MGYEMGFWNVPPRWWVTCAVPLVKCVCRGLYRVQLAAHLIVLVFNGSWLTLVDPRPQLISPETSSIETEGLLFLLPTITPHFWKCGMYLLESTRRRLCRPVSLDCVSSCCMWPVTGARQVAGAGDSPARPLPRGAPPLLWVHPLVVSPAQLCTAPKATGVRIRCPQVGHGRNPPGVEVSFRPYGISKWGSGLGGALSPSGPCPTNKHMVRICSPFYGWGNWDPEREMI